MANAGSVNVEIGATFASTFKGAFGSAERQMAQLGATARELDAKLQRAQGLQRQRQAAIDAEGAWRQADAELRAMGQHLAGLGSITDKQARDFKALEKRTEAARQAMEKARAEADRMGREMTEAGQSTEDLAGQQKELERQLEATTNRMKAMAGLANAGVGKAFGEIGAQFRTLAMQATIAGAGVGYVFKTQFLDVASEFEKFKTILETTEGSAAGADKAMKWVSDFAAKTPFELAEVTEAFVKLRAYGLDPTKGLLQTLGDTGAAMGKPIMQAVEAIADAVMGENERLKELGIIGSKKGSQITYEYTDKAGKQRTKTVDAENRKLIESTLTAIWNEKYGGAMNKLSGTWAGMMSNLNDQWARFTNNVMNAGLFEWMKGRLSGFLNQLDTMAANGQLQAWAEATGKKMVEFAEAVWTLGKSIVDTTSKIATFVGGWENLGVILVGLTLSPLILSFGQLGLALFSATNFLLMFATGTATAGAAWMAFGAGMVKWAGLALGAFKALAMFMLANPVGIALTLLTTAGFLLWKNWDSVKVGLAAIWATIRDTAIAAFDAIKSAVGSVINWLTEKTAWIFATVDKVKAAANSIGDVIGGAWGRAKAFVGVGEATPPAASGAAPAQAAAVPAGRVGGSVTTSSTINAPITINGATDPKATAAAVRAELDRRERELAAGRRALLIDAMGY